MLWTAFILGLFGSLHCLGMCGPIALALPLDRSSKVRTLLGALTYNLGRILTYATLGLLFGQIGYAFELIGLQRWVSIAAGVTLLVLVLITYALKRAPQLNPTWSRGISHLKSGLQQLLGRKTYSSLLGIGLLNGLLPCGFVYFALVGAIGMGQSLQGAAYMALFGMGTVPLMLAVNLLGSKVHGRYRASFNRAIPYVLVAFAVLFILRGMSLGIPFISPIIESAEPVSINCH